VGALPLFPRRDGETPDPMEREESGTEKHYRKMLNSVEVESLLSFLRILVSSISQAESLPAEISQMRMCNRPAPSGGLDGREAFMTDTIDLIRRTTLFLAGTGAIFVVFLVAVRTLS
jgi:hypothetical protein